MLTTKKTLINHENENKNKSNRKKQIGKYLEGNYIQPQSVGDVMNEYQKKFVEGSNFHY